MLPEPPRMLVPPITVAAMTIELEAHARVSRVDGPVAGGVEHAGQSSQRAGDDEDQEDHTVGLRCRASRAATGLLPTA